MPLFNSNVLPKHFSNSEKVFLSKILNQEIDFFPENMRMELSKKWLLQLEEGMPYQYILEKAHFYGLDFFINKNVLIPRPETEELVDYAIKNLQFNSMIDLGTGSGCIPISIKKRFPNAIVSALDISSQALTIAKKNAIQHQVDIQFFEDDMLNQNLNYPKFDLIISNPPYIGEEEQLDNIVLNFEPHLALFSDLDVLKFYRAIAVFARQYLNPKGNILLEINQKYGKETAAVFDEHGFNASILQDMSGNDRFILAKY